MRGRVIVFVMAAVMAARAQQGSAPDSGAAKAPEQGAAPSNAPPPSKTTNSGQQPSASDLSRDLTFPESEPEAPSSPSSTPKTHAPSMAPPRSDRVQADELGSGVGESSSKDTQVDLSAPEDDSKTHPQSSNAVAEAEAETMGTAGVTEFHTWDPHKAAKSVEVGDFYFKRKNYRAAEERYREALRYKDNDAVATIRLAVSLEKLGILDGARAEYESYLKILPHGPQAAEAQKSIDRLKTETAAPRPAQ